MYARKRPLPLCVYSVRGRVSVDYVEGPGVQFQLPAVEAKVTLNHRVFTEWQPATFWRTFHHGGTAPLGVSGGCTPSPFHSIYHHEQSCGVRSRWEADTLSLLLLYPYRYSVLSPRKRTLMRGLQSSLWRVVGSGDWVRKPGSTCACNQANLWLIFQWSSHDMPVFPAHCQRPRNVDTFYRF